jgi:hypothetical protein
MILEQTLRRQHVFIIIFYIYSMPFSLPVTSIWSRHWVQEVARCDIYCIDEGGSQRSGAMESQQRTSIDVRGQYSGVVRRSANINGRPSKDYADLCLELG